MRTRWLITFVAVLVGFGAARAQAPSSPPSAGNVGLAPATHEETGAPAPLDGLKTPDACWNSPAHGAGEPWGPAGLFWARAEYLVWWVRNGAAPPLLGVAPGSLFNASILPPSSITSIFGGTANFNYGDFSGGRLSVGGWLDQTQDWGLDASGFVLEHRTINVSASSSGSPILGPIFFDPTSKLETIIKYAALPNRHATADASVDQRFGGADANVRWHSVSVFSTRSDLLFGFRYLSFDEGLQVVATTTVNADAPQGAGSGGTTFDTFGTHNRFYGVQVGFDDDFRCGKWFAQVQCKFAIGDIRQEATINGGTTFFTPGQPNQTFVGGVVAQPTNIGRYHSDDFCFVPEVTLNIGYQFTQYLRAFIGYNFLYMSSIARPGDQVDFNVTPFQIHNLSRFDPTKPATQPSFNFHDTELWAQGLNFGVEFRY